MTAVARFNANSLVARLTCSLPDGIHEFGVKEYRRRITDDAATISNGKNPLIIQLSYEPQVSADDTIAVVMLLLHHWTRSAAGFSGSFSTSGILRPLPSIFHR